MYPENRTHSTAGCCCLRPQGAARWRGSSTVRTAAVTAVSTAAGQKLMATWKDTLAGPTGRPGPCRTCLGKVTHSFLCAWPQETDLHSQQGLPLLGKVSPSVPDLTAHRLGSHCHLFGLPVTREGQRELGQKEENETSYLTRTAAARPPLQPTPHPTKNDRVGAQRELGQLPSHGPHPASCPPAGLSEQAP